MKCGLPILNVWETPSDNFPGDFLKRANDSVKDIITTCTDDLEGTLSEPLTYGEISKVCSGLKSGASAAAIDFERIRFGGAFLVQTTLCAMRKILR